MLATTREDDGLAQARRWAVVCCLALLVHCVPMFCLTLSAAPNREEPRDEVSMSVDFSELLADDGEAKPADANAAMLRPLVPGTQLQPAIPNVTAPDPMVAPQIPVVPPQAVPNAKPAVAPEPPKPRAPELESLVPVGVAFDESKTTKQEPKNGYLSDRTSTAADKGPKNLPRGDPFMDKGESKVIRYQEKRGEGGLPALKSADTSGSVKKEGNPDAGHGTTDERPPDRKLPSPEPAADEQKALLPRAAKAPDAATAVEPQNTPKTKPELAAKLDAEPPPGVGLEPVRRKRIEKKTSETAPERAATAPARPSPAPLDDPREGRSARKAETAADELAAFKALLDGKGKAGGHGGEDGDKPGVHDRSGARGHEGDGTLRPGHDEAVSDVTTINLESSAEEFDESRFAKKFDARTAYIKPLARRIDNKWKAERVARNRFRILHGVVTFRIVVRKDGTLLEAAEASRSPKDLPDEYAASAKIAIERAADPKSEPFPAGLADHDTLDFSFNFLY